MRRSLILNDQDYRNLHNLSRACEDLRHDPELMHQARVDGLAALIGAERGLSIVVDRSATPNAVQWGGFAGRFAWEPLALSQFEPLIEKGPLLADEGFAFAARELDQQPQVVMCRKTAWPNDRAWDASAASRAKRGLMIEDVLLAAFRAKWEEGPEIVFGVALHRLRDGTRSRRFNERDIRLLAVFNQYQCDAFHSGSLGHLSRRAPAPIKLSIIQRYCFHAFYDGASQQEIADDIERTGLVTGFVDRSFVWRRLQEVAVAVGVGCPNDLRLLGRPLRRQRK